MQAGPRVIFKDDRDSSIGRGAFMRGGHFRPEMAIIIWAMAASAPAGLSEIVVTEGWRDGDGLHPQLRALDFRMIYEELAPMSLGEIAGFSQAWVRRAGDLLGPDYQVILHGQGSNFHAHWELDPS